MSTRRPYTTILLVSPEATAPPGNLFISTLYKIAVTVDPSI